MADIDRLQDHLLDELAFREDDTIYNAFKHVFDLLRQTRNRTGGDTDLIADNEVAVISQDGGNRSIIRMLRDKVDELESLIIESEKPKNYDAELSELSDRIAQLGRRRIPDSQDVFDLIMSLRRQNRLLESKIHELETRIDSGV